MRWETFTPLTNLGIVTHAFTLRTDADTKSGTFHTDLLRSLELPVHRYVTAEQTHGHHVAVVTDPAELIPGVDALVTNIPGLALLIRCADCAAVFIVDPATPAVALIHSGKQGTLGNIAGRTVETMRQRYGTDPARCLAYISPCIGPCHYELDIASAIATQLRATGVSEIHQPGICTACHLDRYFSYRAERGQTGRMWALLSLRHR